MGYITPASFNSSMGVSSNPTMKFLYPLKYRFSPLKYLPSALYYGDRRRKAGSIPDIYKWCIKIPRGSRSHSYWISTGQSCIRTEMIFAFNFFINILQRLWKSCSLLFCYPSWKLLKFLKHGLANEFP